MHCVTAGRGPGFSQHGGSIRSIATQQLGSGKADKGLTSRMHKRNVSLIDAAHTAARVTALPMFRRAALSAARVVCDNAASCSGRTWAECLRGGQPPAALAAKGAGRQIGAAHGAPSALPVLGYLALQRGMPLQQLQPCPTGSIGWRSYATVVERKKASNPGEHNGVPVSRVWARVQRGGAHQQRRWVRCANLPP